MRGHVMSSIGLSLSVIASGCASVTDLAQTSVESDRPTVVHVVGSNTGFTVGVPTGVQVSLGRQHFSASYVRSVAGPTADTRVRASDTEGVSAGEASAAAGLQNGAVLEVAVVAGASDE